MHSWRSSVCGDIDLVGVGVDLFGSGDGAVEVTLLDDYECNLMICIICRWYTGALAEYQ